jgi:hypothetical protein
MQRSVTHVTIVSRSLTMGNGNGNLLKKTVTFGDPKTETVTEQNHNYYCIINIINIHI